LDKDNGRMEGWSNARLSGRLRMTAVGRDDQFRPPSIERRSVGKETFAGMGGKEEDAQIPDLPALTFPPSPRNGEG
jgi:hypothetical protein